MNSSFLNGYLLAPLLFFLFLKPGMAYAQNDKMDHSEHTMSAQDMMNSGQEMKGEKWIKEKTGEYIPLNLEFVAEDGRKITLGSIIDSIQPCQYH